MGDIALPDSPLAAALYRTQADTKALASCVAGKPGRGMAGSATRAHAGAAQSMSTRTIPHLASPCPRLIRVAVADDHPLQLAGLLHELQAQPHIHIACTATNFNALLKLQPEHAIDVIIADYDLPDRYLGDGTSPFGLLRQRFSRAGLIALCMANNIHVVRSLLAQNVHGILCKTDPLAYLSTCVLAVSAGKRYLSPGIEAIVRRHWARNGWSLRPRYLSTRELEVVRLFVRGYTVGEIAHHLERSKQTVSSQKRSAMRKLGLRRDADLIKYGIQEQLTSQGVETLVRAQRPSCSRRRQA
jgi:two-component system capsular synthesis response regulator RcsB